MAISKIIVVGGGMAGLASALAITKSLSSAGITLPSITVFELREKPNTIGGAVNLTPTALRCLDILGVLDELKGQHAGTEVADIRLFSLHNGSSLGQIDFSGPNGDGFGGYRGRRVSRGDLLHAMLAAVQKLDNVSIVYGKRVKALEENEDSVTVKFLDNTDETGDLVLGCDGIHSATRTAFVEPGREPKYSGIATAYGFCPISEKQHGLVSSVFPDTGLLMARRGSLLTTFHNDARDSIYLAGVIESKNNLSKDGWRVIGCDQDAMKADLASRFGGDDVAGSLGFVKDLIRGAQEWFLYPVYILPPNGKWYTKRVMLLGDAAHAMPPRGESIGFALEDAIKFSTILAHFGLASPVEKVFTFYESVRRKNIEDSYKEASFGWDTNKDSGWLMMKTMEYMTPLFMWWTKKRRDEAYGEDPRDVQFPS